MKVSQYGGNLVGCALIVALSSFLVFFCGIWLLRSATLVQTMGLTALSVCGSGFAALRDLRTSSAVRSRQSRQFIEEPPAHGNSTG